jgi:hypothetical protein
MNDIVKQRIDSRSLLNGLLLMGIGTLFLFDRLHIADFGDLFRMYWPMIIILFGVSYLFRRECLWTGLWFMAIGVWFQVVRLHLFGLTWRNSWPLLLIVMGGGIMLRAMTDAAAPAPKEERRER